VTPLGVHTGTRVHGRRCCPARPARSTAPLGVREGHACKRGVCVRAYVRDVRACVRAWVRAWVRACVCVCVCVRCDMGRRAAIRGLARGCGVGSIGLPVHVQAASLCHGRARAQLLTRCKCVTAASPLSRTSSTRPTAAGASERSKGESKWRGAERTEECGHPTARRALLRGAVVLDLGRDSPKRRSGGAVDVSVVPCVWHRRGQRQAR